MSTMTSDDALIEAMARAEWAANHFVREWEDAHPDDRTRYLTRNRAALAAIRKTHAVLEAKPSAWRVKDYADGWIFFKTEQGARFVASQTDALIQPLYLLAASEDSAHG